MRLYRKYGLWQGHAQLVHLYVDGISNGIYMLEHFDAVKRMGASSAVIREIGDIPISAATTLFLATFRTRTEKYSTLVKREQPKIS